MMTKQRCFHGGYTWIFILTAAFLTTGNCLFAAGQTRVSREAGYIIYPLEHISVEQGKKYLTKVMTGTVTHFPGSSSLLVTAEPLELNKAKTILDLVDGPEQFVVKAILPVSAARNMPSNEQLAAKLTTSITRGVSIGSFSNPPDKNAHTKAIIDIHNDTVVAIAPLSLLDKIDAVIVQSQNSGALASQNISKTRDKLESPAKRESSNLFERNAASFLFAANDMVETDPNIAETVVKQEKPEPSAADGQEESTSLPNGEQVVNLALAERQKLTVAEFLGLVGPYLQLDFMYDDKDVAEEVTINPHGKFRGPIKIKDLYPLLEEVLKFKHLAMTRGKGNLVTIAPADNALDIDPALLEKDGGKIEHGDGVIQRIFTLKHIGTTTAQTFLTNMKLTTSITAIPETKTLILTGYAHRMERIQALLNIVDKPGELKKFRFRQLQYTEAQTLAPKIQSLAEQLGTISITIAETSAEESPSIRISPKRPTETAAQYQARVRQAQAAAARRRATTARTTTTGQEPESELPTVYLDADERTNRILMIGLDEQLVDVEELISTLDVVQQDLRTLELYKINHVDAEEAKKHLEELGIISPSLMGSPYSSRLTTGAKPPTTTTAAARTQTSSAAATAYGETTEALAGEPKVVIVEPVNSLLVNATAEQHVKIAEIISYVDAETDKTEIPYKVYPLENQSPDHLAEVLEPLIQENVLDKEGKVESVRQKQEEQITIVPDPNTFSLIVSASKKNQEWIKNLIDQLDKRRPQVLIDVTLVEVYQTDSFEYDLKLIESFPNLTNTSGLTLPLMGEPSSSDSLIGRLERDHYADFQSRSGAGTGFYADRHINALLTLMQNNGYGRVLAKPKILVNDNELGHIDTTNTIYVSRSSSSATTTGEAVVSSSYTFDEFPSGIQLDITPHISKGSLLRLEINMTRSDQAAPTASTSAEESANKPPPPKKENKIETTVTVPDKSTIILGGILTLNQTKDTRKVPIIGDIPIVGGLFRSIDNRSDDTRLYIFVKGEILRPDETLAGLPDLEQISERNKIAFEEFENKFQNYQEWPGIKPKPVEPYKVLETQ